MRGRDIRFRRPGARVRRIRVRSSCVERWTLVGHGSGRGARQHVGRREHGVECALLKRTGHPLDACSLMGALSLGQVGGMDRRKAFATSPGMRDLSHYTLSLHDALPI